MNKNTKYENLDIIVKSASAIADNCSGKKNSKLCKNLNLNLSGIIVVEKFYILQCNGDNNDQPTDGQENEFRAIWLWKVKICNVIFIFLLGKV